MMAMMDVAYLLPTGGLMAQAELAWSKGRRPPGAVATFIVWTVRALVIGFLCNAALEIVGVIIIIIIIIIMAVRVGHYEQATKEG